MTYADIARWVEANFPLDQYFDPGELIRDVRKQFEFDGTYFPPEAGANIKQTWIDQFGYSDRALDVESNQRETLEDIRNDYRDRFSNFFENTMPYETQTPEETLATPPPVIEQMPDFEEQQKRENSSWYAGGFRNIASRIWSRLRGQ